MSSLKQLVNDYKGGLAAGETFHYRDFFMKVLHQAPYHCKYTLEKELPELMLIHTTPLSDMENPVVQECNGLIVRHSDFSVVAAGMRGLVEKKSIEDIGVLDGIPLDELGTPEGFSIEAAEDGTVLRVFHYDGAWIVSSHRRIHAKRAFWASDRSFYDLLQEAICGTVSEPGSLETVFDQFLDRQLVYSFILMHPQSHHVIFAPLPKVFAVTARDPKTLVEEKVISLPFASAPERLSLEEAKSLLRGEDVRGLLSTKRGIIVADMRDPKCIQRYKIDFPRFARMEELRRNYPTMNLSYLAAKNSQEREELREAFGTVYGDMFTAIEQAIFYLAKDILGIYKDSYIRKQFYVDPTDDSYPILRSLHGRYKQTGERTFLGTVVEHIRRRDAYQLHSLLERKLAEGRLSVKKIVRPPGQTQSAEHQA